MKLAFKATDISLTCRKESFKIGETYSKERNKSIALCTEGGYHYCMKWQDTRLYSYPVSTSRHFIISVTGDYKEDNDKGITTEFTLLKEITDLVRNNNVEGIQALFEEMEKTFKKENYEYFLKKDLREEIIKELKEEKEKEEEKIEKIIKDNLNIELVKEFCKVNPLAIVGGSVALFLHGVRLDRFRLDRSDIDIILPYYVPFETGNNLSIKVTEEEIFSNKTFTEVRTIDFITPKEDTAIMSMNPVKLECLIDPHETWEYIEYDGFKFKVNSLNNIWKAKISYNKTKHNEDLKELCTKK